MSNDSLDRDYAARVTAADNHLRDTVATGGAGTLADPMTSVQVLNTSATPDVSPETPPRTPENPDLPPTRTNEEIDALLLQMQQAREGETAPQRKEFTVELPEVQAIRQQFKEHVDKISTGEAALAEVGKAGRSVAEAIAPGIEVAGRAIGLDEEGAAALSRGMVEFLAGLPGQEESDLHAGFETALASIPALGLAMKSGKIAGDVAKKTIKYVLDGQASKMAIEPRSLDPERFKTVTEETSPFKPHKNFDEETFGTTIKVRVQIPDKLDQTGFNTFDDEIKGLNVGHALRRAADNWEDAALIQVTGVKNKTEQSAMQAAIDILMSERGSVPVSGGGGKQPPLPPSKAGGLPAQPPDPFKKKRKAVNEEAQRAWEQASAQFDGFKKSVTKQRRGPTLSDVEVIKLSKASDVTLNSALGIPPGTALAPEHLLRVRNLLKGQMKAMKKANKVYRETQDVADIKPLVTSMGRTQGLLKVLLGLYAEPARDVRIMRAGLPKDAVVKAEAGDQFIDNPSAFEDLKEREFRIADEWINHLYDFFVNIENAAKATPRKPGQPALPGSVLQDVSDAVELMQTEEEFVGFLKPLQNPVFWDVWKENWYNGMLLSLAPVKNLLGTPTILAAEIAQRGVMAGLDAGGTGLVKMLADVDLQRSVYFGEVGAMLNMRANVEAFMGGAKLAWHTFTSGKQLVDPSALEHAIPAVSDTALWLHTTGPMGQATSWMTTAGKWKTTKGIDLASTTGGRLLLAGDALNKFVAHQAELRALALRKAYMTVDQEGLTGVEAVNRVQEVKRDVLGNPERYPEIVEQARHFAQYVALQEELGTAASSIGNLANTLTIGPREAGFPSGFPVGRWLMPFTTIMANAAKMAGEYTGPLSILSPAVRAELQAGGTRQLTQLAKISFSTMMLDSFYALAQEGNITGNGPRDKAAKQAWMEATGKIPNAWYDPVGKTYRSCAAFEPFCTVTSAVADMVDLMSYTPPDKVDQLNQAFQALAVAVANNVGIKNWTQGLVGTLNAGMSGDFASYEEWFAKAGMGATVPYSGALRQITAGLDPHLRQAVDMIDQLKKDIPGLSDTLPPEKNALGRIILRRNGWWNPFSHGIDSQDKDIWQALKKHDIVIRKPEQSIDGVPLSAKLYDQYVDAVTDGLPEALQDFADQSDTYSDAEAQRRVAAIVEHHRALGKEHFLAEYEQVKQAIEQKAFEQEEGKPTGPSRYAPGRLSTQPRIGP